MNRHYKLLIKTKHDEWWVKDIDFLLNSKTIPFYREYCTTAKWQGQTFNETERELASVGILELCGKKVFDDLEWVDILLDFELGVKDNFTGRINEMFPMVFKEYKGKVVMVGSPLGNNWAHKLFMEGGEGIEPWLKGVSPIWHEPPYMRMLWPDKYRFLPDFLKIQPIINQIYTDMNTVVKCTNVNQGEGVQTVTLSNEANMEGFAPHGIKRGGSGYATIARDSRNEPQEKPTPKISIVIEIREHEKGYNHYKPGCFYTYSQMAIPQAINLNAKNEE